MSSTACKDCERVQKLLEDYEMNFREVPVLHSMLLQLRKALPAEQGTEEKPKRGKDYTGLIGILPYSLWPDMLSR